MSGVYTRNRNLSKFEYYNNAIQLRAMVAKMMNSKSVPKAWRFTLAVPMMETARGILNDIVTSDAFYPNKEIWADERRRYLTLAIAGCGHLSQDVQLAMDVGLPVGEARLEAVSDAIEREIALLKGARSGVKLSHGFTFLKKKFLYGENGRVIVRPCRASIARARRRLRKQAGLVRRGVMTMDEVNRSYQSVRGAWSKLDAHRTVLEFDRLYRELFGGIS